MRAEVASRVTTGKERNLKRGINKQCQCNPHTDIERQKEKCRNLLMVERETACTVDCCSCMGVGGAALSLLWLHVWLNTNTRPTILHYDCTFYQQHGIIHILLSRSLSVSIYLESIMVRHKKDNFSRGGAKKSFTPRPRPRGDNENSSTTSRPPFKAACWDLGHCDPKRCSGKRLMKIGLMRELSIGQRYPGVIVS